MSGSKTTPTLDVQSPINGRTPKTEESRVLNRSNGLDTEGAQFPTFEQSGLTEAEYNEALLDRRYGRISNVIIPQRQIEGSATPATKVAVKTEAPPVEGRV